MDNMTYSCSARYELRMRERLVGGNGDFVQEIVTVPSTYLFASLV